MRARGSGVGRLKAADEAVDQPDMGVRLAVGALGLAAAGALTVAGVHALQHTRNEIDASAARTAAQKVSALPGAHRSRECHGDGLVSCFTVADSVVHAAHAMAWSITAASGHPAVVTCSSIVAGPAAGRRTCVVAVRWDNHAVTSFVDPHVVRVENRRVVSGTLVALSAS